MPTVVILADPPVPGVALSELAEGTPLSTADSAELYGAMLADVCEAVQEGVGELLVNYRSGDQLDTDADPQSCIEACLEDEVPRPDDVRYEVQVGETFAGRVGNTASHLLEEEGVDSVAIAEPTAAFLSREHVGTVAMKLRTRDVVLGPTTAGRVYLTAVGDTLDFADVFAPPAVETVTARAREADLDVGFAPMLPVVETPADLASAISIIRARVGAGRNVPPRTAAFVADHDLRVVADDGGLAVVTGEA